ncbi:hypothetical protein [Streptomyces sp. GZWMJZ-114]|uniref:hypothetical protein n=1 Tax=Streptomyces sp. GZWMJZ-114 TaxID=2494734 RepID=UPI0010114F37|nr:hypothetical protein [Streptomyces sp. GZWMJZ-114]
MSDPLNRTMFLVDIENFSRRDDVEQSFLRRMLYDVVDRTMEHAGIDETLRLRADQGDSLMEFIDPNVPSTRLLRTLLTELPALLRQRNRLAARAAQIRLRAVLASGYIALDERGIWVGSDLNHACRLLDADLLRSALRERSGDLALCVSESVHHGIVRHDHQGIPAEDFHAVTMHGKNGPLRGWLHGPLPVVSADSASPAPTPAPDTPGERPAPVPTTPTADGTDRHPEEGRRRPATFHFEGGAPTFGGSLVSGDQIGVSGGDVQGDVVMGSSYRSAEPAPRRREDEERA